MPHTGRVFDFFNERLTGEIAQLNPKTLLYIGWRADCNPWWFSKFTSDLRIEPKGITVLEIYSSNADDARKKFQNVVEGDARHADELFFSGQFDIVFWDHGPEHVSNDDLRLCTPKLAAVASKLLLYCCPWGDWPQGPEGGNQYELHYSVSAELLEELGMKIQRFGCSGQQTSGELIGCMAK